MTVAEMIVELQKLPDEACVEVAGYVKSEGGDRKYLPEYIEALKDADGKVSVVIWATESAPQD